MVLRGIRIAEAGVRFSLGPLKLDTDFLRTKIKVMAKEKIKTLDDFAAVIHKDYLELHKEIGEMGGRFWPIERDLKTLTSQVGELRADVKQVTDIMVSKADLANTLGDELAKSIYGRQIDDLRSRVDILEAKLGIKTTRRTA